MADFLKELWTTFPFIFKIILLLGLLGMGWWGYRLTAPDPQVVARIGQLEEILSRSMERAVGQLGHTLYSDLRQALQTSHRTGQINQVVHLLHQSLMPKQPLLPAPLTPSEINILQRFWYAQPTSFSAVSPLQFQQYESLIKPKIPHVKRRNWCTDATAIEPKNDCVAGITASLIMAQQRDSFRGSLPGLIWPFFPGTFGCGVGFRHFPGKPKGAGHYGVDMGASAGEKLWAMADGTVESIGLGGGCGFSIKIAYDNGFKSTYCHMLQPPLKPKGSRVRQGEVVGYVGSTGSSTDPHLHLIVYQQNQGQWNLIRDPIQSLILCQ